MQSMTELSGGGGHPLNKLLYRVKLKLLSGRIGKGCLTRHAFTMAEVLITLGIIGIVAAMTLPAVMGKYQKKVTVEKLKKFYSVITNAARLSEYENGEMADWEFPKQGYDANMNTFFRRYYMPYLKDAKECNSPNCFTKENYSLKSQEFPLFHHINRFPRHLPAVRFSPTAFPNR